MDRAGAMRREGERSARRRRRRKGGVLHLVEGAEMVGGELGEGRGGAGQGGGLLRGEVPQELGRGSAEELREGTARTCAEMF